MKATPEPFIALAALDAAQQRLTTLLMAADRDMQAIIEAADVVRRLERAALQTERGGRVSKSGTGSPLDRRVSHFFAQSD